MKKNIEERGEREDPEIDPDPEKEEEKRAEEEEKPLQITSEEWSRMNIVLQTLQKQIMGQ